MSRLRLAFCVLLLAIRQAAGQDGITIFTPTPVPWDEPSELDWHDLADLLEPLYEPIADELINDLTDELLDSPIANIPLILTGVGTGVVALDQGWVDEIGMPTIPVWDFEIPKNTWDLTIDVTYDLGEIPWEFYEDSVFVEPQLVWTHDGPVWTWETSISVPLDSTPIPDVPISNIELEIKY